MVAAPDAYPWSSYACNAEGSADWVIQPHDAYLALGATPAQRCLAYRALFAEAISGDRLAEIRAYLQQQCALGTGKFQAAIEAELRRATMVRPRGRPSKGRMAGATSNLESDE